MRALRARLPRKAPSPAGECVIIASTQVRGQDARGQVCRSRWLEHRMRAEESPRSLYEVSCHITVSKLWLVGFVRTWQILNPPTTTILIPGFIISYWGYCHNLLHGFPVSAPVPYIYSHTTRVILLKDKSDHVTLLTTSNVIHSFIKVKHPIWLYWMCYLLPSFTFRTFNYPISPPIVLLPPYSSIQGMYT